MNKYENRIWRLNKLKFFKNVEQIIDLTKHYINIYEAPSKNGIYMQISTTTYEYLSVDEDWNQVRKKAKVKIESPIYCLLEENIKDFEDFVLQLQEYLYADKYHYRTAFHIEIDRIAQHINLKRKIAFLPEGEENKISKI